ncbi:hypothetical protein HPULCUR_011971 [Helicostylum pulchrum]|uniref:Uncharacterized protein n=1 Tax=Helicostylum pulchrum TaxID=562976 RepID=A0ABP9YI19_9FUNG
MSQDNEFGSNSSKVFGPKTEICTKGENDENKELENNPPACNFEGDISESETNIKQENDECKDFFKGLLFSAAKTESFSLEASIQDEPSSLEPSAQAEPSSLETSNLIELSSSETNTQDEPSSVETSESENSAATDNLPSKC